MGGRASQGYALFVQLTVKAFLAIRPHAEQLVQSVSQMLGTGFPSFKGEPTIKRLRDRFALGLTERQAAEFMMAIVKNAHENMRSTVYDEFQRLQNGQFHLGVEGLRIDCLPSIHYNRHSIRVVLLSRIRNFISPFCFPLVECNLRVPPYATHSNLLSDLHN